MITYVFGRWRLRSTQRVIRITPPLTWCFTEGYDGGQPFFLAMMNSNAVKTGILPVDGSEIQRSPVEGKR